MSRRAARRNGLTLLALLAIGFGLIVSRGSIQRAEPLAISPAVQQYGGHIVKITLPGDAATLDCLMLVGSLEDAGTTTRIELELSPTADSARSHRDSGSFFAADDTEFTENVGRGRATPEVWGCKPFNLHEKGGERLISASTSHSRNFFVQTGRNPHAEASYQPVTARLVAESEDVRLWLDASSAGMIACEQLAWFLDCLQTEILPAVRELIGDIADVDGDGKLSVCLTPRLEDLPATESPVEGLVQANDFSPDLPRPFSNQADVIFLSPRLRPGSHAKTVMIHEAAHLAVFSHRRAAGAAGLQPEDDWLNEGLAHVAEVACGGGWSNLDRRLVAFASQTADAGLVVIDAQRQGLWRHAGSRAASWLFLAWLADEHGPRVISDLARHPGVGCDKLEEILGQPFPELFRMWSVAVGRYSLREVSRIHSASVAESARESRMAAGLRRAGTMNVLQIDRNHPRREFALRGTAVQIVRCHIAHGAAARLRLCAPGAIRLQVTVLEQTPAGERINVIR